MVKLEQAKDFLTIVQRIVKGILDKLTGKPSHIPKDDVFTRMLRTSFPQQVEFDLVRVGANAGGLLIGSIETTSQATAQVIEFLLINQFFWKKPKPQPNKQTCKRLITSCGKHCVMYRLVPICSAKPHKIIP